jgi:DNA adenine methylase
MKRDKETIDIFTEIRSDYKEAVIENVREKVKQAGKITTDGFIGWIGGKKKVAKKIVSMFPKHDIYVEPFMGSAAVFFAKGKVELSIINDINSNLVNLFEVVAGEEFDEFIYQLWHMIKSTNNFDRMVSIYRGNTWKSLSKAQRASIYYYINIHSFNKDVEGKAFAYNDADINTYVFQKLIRSREKLSGAVIENKRYNKIVSKWNKRNKDVLFFFDPPYVVADSGIYYEYVFNELDHRMLKEECDRIHRNNNYVFLTYDNVPYIRELYKGYNIQEMEYTYSSLLGKKKKVKEIVITNCMQGEQFDFGW